MPAKNIVFIDSRVAGYETLIAGLSTDTEWHLLTAEQDGITQMQRILAKHAGLDSIHVVSHGSTGTLYLGSTVLNSANLANYQSQLQSIGSSLTAIGDILLYGCNVAQGTAGASFVDSLARITGADVAASDDLTGLVAWGGNAKLEMASGSVASKALSLSGMQQTLSVNTAPTFSGSGGKLTTDFGGDDVGLCVLQQTDGKLVVAGNTSKDHMEDFALARYNTDGTLDTSFDGDGKLTTDFSNGWSYREGVSSIIQQSDGKLVVAGYGPDGEGHDDTDYALARYNTDGTLDTSFDGDGKLTTDFGGYDEYGKGVDESASALIQQADGKLVVTGSNGLVRYNADGTIDTSFDGGSKLLTNFVFGSSVAKQADGKLVVAGSSNGDFTLARYNTNGTLDTSFAPAASLYEGQSGNVILDKNIRIFDADLSTLGHYGGASVALFRHGGTNAQDLFGSTGTLSTLNEGSYFSVDSVTIGRVTTNSAGTLKLSFNSNATQNLVDKALQQIGYTNSSDAPPASVQIDWVFNDGNTGAQGTGGALSVTGSSTVTISPTNDAPLNGNLLQTQTAVINTPFTYTLPSGAFSDPDLEKLTYSINMADGSGVPPWLKINTASGALSGTPDPLDLGTFTLRITARDAAGATASDAFSLTVVKGLVLEGTTGNDRLTGNGGNDTLNGYSGNDTLDGGIGIDSMNGGDGSDVYYVRDSGDVISETNAASAGGNDTVYHYLSGYTLGANVENGRIMAAGAANLTGNTLDNVIYASAGNNMLAGGAGTDTLSYAYGVSGTNGVTVSLAATSAQTTVGSGSDSISGFENLTGSSNNDRLTGSSSNNVLNGGAGTDALVGGAGDDTYYVDVAGDTITETSSGGKDLVLSSLLGTYVMGAYVEEGRINTTGSASLTGNGLANILYAGSGNNTLDGAAGTDTASYQYGLVSGATAGVKVSLASAAGQATGRSGTDKLVNIENLTGSSLNDTLTGSTGNNVLDGGSGNDSLSGGDGHDTLIGGADKDTLVGGKGNDVFDFNALSEMGATSRARDVISDFVRGQDKIDLSTLDANTATTKNDAFNGTLIAATAKFTAAGQLKLAAGVLYGNTDADVDAEFAIQLTGVTALNAADFVL